MTCLRCILLVFIMLASVFACAHGNLDETFVSEPYVRERWLPYIADGKTERNEIIQRLGEPTSSFQNGTILGYRLILIEEDRDVSEKEYRSILINLGAAYLQGYYGWVAMVRGPAIPFRGPAFSSLNSMTKTLLSAMR